MASKKMMEMAKKYNLVEVTTTEELEYNWHIVVPFGDKVLLAGYFYQRGENSFFAAVYGYALGDRDIEAPIVLSAVSQEMFEDAGHALQWAMAQ